MLYRLLKEIERDFGLKQLITKATRITANTLTLIDFILTDISSTKVLDICISDYLPIYYVKKKVRENNKKEDWVLFKNHQNLVNGLIFKAKNNDAWSN